MRLNCVVEVTYSLALAAGGGVSSKSSRSKASVCLGKKPFSKFPEGEEESSSTGRGKGRDELYLTVSTIKNVEGTRYKVRRETVWYNKVSLIHLIFLV